MAPCVTPTFSASAAWVPQLLMAIAIDVFTISLVSEVSMIKNNTIVLNEVNTTVVCLPNTFVLESTTMRYGERLRAAREHKGLTQEELVKISGVKQGTISKIERGDQNSSGFDAVLSHHLDVNAMWLTTGDDKFAPAWLITGETEKKYTNYINEPEVKGEVPLVSFAQVGAWSETTLNLRPTDGETMVRSRVPVMARTFAVIVPGDSMEPEFVEGDTIIVEPTLQHKHKSFVIAKKGEDVLFRQIIQEGANWLLKPLNERYSIIPLGEYQIVGVIREKAKFYE